MYVESFSSGCLNKMSHIILRLWLVTLALCKVTIECAQQLQHSNLKFNSDAFRFWIESIVWADEIFIWKYQFFIWLQIKLTWVIERLVPDSINAFKRWLITFLAGGLAPGKETHSRQWEAFLVQHCPIIPAMPESQAILLQIV